MPRRRSSLAPSNPASPDNAVLRDRPALARLRRALPRWFAQHQRELPWRRNRDPYPIWVSEVMLQQTQVATVIPYFERFLRAFPTLADLAGADEREVLRLWEGLGYYRRARDLHRSARRVMDEFGGAFPRDPIEASRLPGLGRYMVGAVLSQAYDQRLPIVEANSQRLLCRLFGQRADPRRGEARRWLWETAAAILPARRVGDFNQALMELGALVCTPSTPSCGLCPLANQCVAHRLGLEEEIPARAAAPETIDVQEAAVVVRRADQILLAQRPDQGRWAGLWEFPHGELKEGETHEQAARRWLRELTGLRAELGAELATLHHGVTRFRITLVCFVARHQRGEFRSSFYRQAEWVRPEQLEAFPVSVPQRRLAKALLEPPRQPHLF